MSNYPLDLHVFHRVLCAVSEPCKATFVLVARYLSSPCMYIRAGSGAIRRQIMASHHGRGNRLMKNVRPVETFPIIKWNAKKIVPAIIRFPSFDRLLSLSLSASFFLLFSFLFSFFFSRFRCLHNGSASRPQVRRFTKFFDYPFVRGRKTVRLLPGITAFSAEDTHRTELIRQRVRDTSPVLYSLPACMLLPGCIMKIAECSICKESRSIERCVMVLRNYTFRGEGVFLLFYSSRSLAFPLSNRRS